MQNECTCNLVDNVGTSRSDIVSKQFMEVFIYIEPFKTDLNFIASIGILGNFQRAPIDVHWHQSVETLSIANFYTINSTGSHNKTILNMHSYHICYYCTTS